MACAMLAMLGAGANIDEYYAYEIDKYAIETATYNFPQIIECGDVFKADFTQYKDIDFIMGGSPCTYWSIAQKNNRETEASGLGWELFSQYVRALNDIKPRFFIYENNKSMSKAIRESITQTFGFDAICINSALVSAQNRQRLYWVGKRNEDGTYSKVDVQQPEDRGILLRDILDGAMDLTSNDKAWTLTASYDGAVAWNTIERSQRNMCVELVGETKDGKSYCLTAGYSNGSGEKKGNYAAHTLEKGCKSMVAEQLRIPKYGNTDKSRPLNAHYANNSGTGEGSLLDRLLSNNKAKQQVDLIAMPVNTTQDGKSQTIKAQCQMTSVDNICRYKSTYGASGVAEPVSTPTAVTELYAAPLEFKNDVPIKAISQSDGKIYTVYIVSDGKITIKDKEYKIKLQDGYYIIRKLSVAECKRLQTVPDWYEFPVSNAQAYKMLGNGWTVEVIIHLIKNCLEKEN